MDDNDDDGVDMAPWVGYDELARLLGEPVETVYPVQDTDVSNGLVDFSWLVDDDTVDDQSSVPVSPNRSGSMSSVDTTADDSTAILDDSHEHLIDDSLQGVLMTDEDVEAALARNRECQAAIQEMLEAVQEELAAVSRCLGKAREFRESHPQMFSTAKAILEDPMAMLLKHGDDGDFQLTEQQRTALIRLQTEHLSKQRSAKWSKEQRRQLARGVRQQNQKLMMDKVMEAGGPLSHIQTELERIRRLQDDRQLEWNTEGLDFDKIARLFVPKKTGKECELRWLNADHPRINHDEHWTDREMTVLRELGGDKSLSWTEIATRMGTNRSAFACLCQYQRTFQPHLNKGKWQPEEDELLRRAVKRHGEGDWTRIACLVPNRTPQQCIHRWRNTLAPTIRRGRWTDEEDRLLRDAVLNNPNSTWQAIAQHVPGRTDVKCRERWANVLDPSIRRSAFTADEDAALRRAVAQVGEGKWAAIAAMLPGRTDSQCRRRWRAVSRDDARAAEKKQKRTRK